MENCLWWWLSSLDFQNIPYSYSEEIYKLSCANDVCKWTVFEPINGSKQIDAWSAGLKDTINFGGVQLLSPMLLLIAFNGMN